MRVYFILFILVHIDYILPHYFYFSGLQLLRIFLWNIIFNIYFWRSRVTWMINDVRYHFKRNCVFLIINVTLEGNVRWIRFRLIKWHYRFVYCAKSLCKSAQNYFAFKSFGYNEVIFFLQERLKWIITSCLSMLNR